MCLVTAVNCASPHTAAHEDPCLCSDIPLEVCLGASITGNGCIFQLRAFSQSFPVNGHCTAFLDTTFSPYCLVSGWCSEFPFLHYFYCLKWFLTGSSYCEEKCSQVLQRLSLEARAGMLMSGKMMSAHHSLNNPSLAGSTGQRSAELDPPLCLS